MRLCIAGIVIGVVGAVVWAFARADRRAHPEWDDEPILVGAFLTGAGATAAIIGGLLWAL